MKKYQDPITDEISDLIEECKITKEEFQEIEDQVVKELSDVVPGFARAHQHEKMQFNASVGLVVFDSIIETLNKHNLLNAYYGVFKLFEVGSFDKEKDLNYNLKILDLICDLKVKPEKWDEQTKIIKREFEPIMRDILEDPTDVENKLHFYEAITNTYLLLDTLIQRIHKHNQFSVHYAMSNFYNSKAYVPTINHSVNVEIFEKACEVVVAPDHWVKHAKEIKDQILPFYRGISERQAKVRKFMKNKFEELKQTREIDQKLDYAFEEQNV